MYVILNEDLSLFLVKLFDKYVINDKDLLHYYYT